MKPDLIDVSTWQSPALVPYPKLRQQGILGVIVRGTYGGSPDRSAHEHGRRTLAEGLELGVYGYPTPRGDAAEAQRQAEALISLWDFLGGTIAPAVDWEAPPGDFPLVADGHRLAAWMAAYHDRCRELLAGRGVREIVYTGPGWWRYVPKQAARAFAEHGLWVANYGVTSPIIPAPWDEHLLWQYAGNATWSDGSYGPAPKTHGATRTSQPGKIEGYVGEIDVNALGNASIEDLRAGRQPRTPLDLAQPRDRQRALRRLGGDVQIDGAWGPGSRAALVLAQRELGVEADGVWGPETERAVREAISDQNRKAEEGQAGVPLR